MISPATSWASEVCTQGHVTLYEPMEAQQQSISIWTRLYWRTFAIAQTEKWLSLSSRILALLAIVCLASLGCDEGRTIHRVNGKVIFKKDQSPAQFGSVEFRSETEPHEIARGLIEKDGTFDLQTGNQMGAVEGWHTVVIIQASGNTRASVVKHDHGLDIAQKYLDHRKTDLRVEVTRESAKDLTIEVDDDKPKR